MLLKQLLIWLLAVALFAFGVWFFHTSSEFLVEGDYLAGLLHVGAGLALVRSGVEMARLAVLSRMRAP